MFDDVDNKKEIKPTKPQSPQPIKKEGTPVAPEKNKPEETDQGQVHTMPMNYYLGDETVDATKGGTAKKVTPAKAGKSSSGGKKIGKIVGIIALFLLVVASGVLLYFTYIGGPEEAEEPVLGDIPKVVEKPQQPETIITEPIVEEPEEAKEEEPAEPETEPAFNPDELNKFSLSLLSSTDTDRDGLTDEEEDLIGTNMNLSDTDGDTYQDGEEIENFYNPLASGSERLSDVEFIASMTSNKLGYKVLYPSAWVSDFIDETTEQTLMISSNDNEFINVIMEQKMMTETVQDWYLRQAPSVKRSQLKLYKNFNNLSVVESPDGFTTYIGQDNKVFIINYSIGLKDEANYPNIYKMIVNSFEFVEVTAEMVSDTASCTTAACFDPLFKTCTVGETLVMDMPSLNIGHSYEIVSLETDGCKILNKFTMNEDENLVGPTMECLLDNSLSFEEARDMVINDIISEKNTCEGELYNTMINL